MICSIRNHQYPVEHRVSHNRSSKCQQSVYLALVSIEMGKRIVVPHKHGKSVVPRNADDASSYAGMHPHIPGVAQISDVLDEGKAHSYADSVNYSVEMFVEIRIVPQNQPQYEKFGTFLWNSCAEKGEAEIPDHPYRLA